MIEAIFHTCEIIVRGVCCWIRSFLRSLCHCKAASNKIRKNRLKKFIKDNEQKAVPCHCGGRAHIEHRFGEFYHIGCPYCPVGFTNEDIPKLVKMWNDVQSIKAGDYVDVGIFKGRVQSISYGEARVYTDTYNASVEVPLSYLKKIRSSSARWCSMKTGTARKGMRVRIIGNHNSHGFSTGQVITLGDKTPHLANNYGYSFRAPSELGAIFCVREIDMAPVGATLV